MYHSMCKLRNPVIMVDLVPCLTKYTFAFPDELLKTYQSDSNYVLKPKDIASFYAYK
jgi:hypothetical protein